MTRLQFIIVAALGITLGFALSFLYSASTWDDQLAAIHEINTQAKRMEAQNEHHQ